MRERERKERKMRKQMNVFFERVGKKKIRMWKQGQVKRKGRMCKRDRKGKRVAIRDTT